MRMGRGWSWWRVTGFLAWVGVAVCAIVAIAALAFQHMVGPFTILAIPVGVFLGVVVIPAVLIALVFVHADRQQAVDRGAEIR